MMMNGRPSAHRLSMNARHRSLPEVLGGVISVSLRTTHHQATARLTPSIRPGKMPARNSLEIDRPLATPNTTKPMLGGMTGPMMPDAAIRPPELALLWPALTIIGTSRAESAAASATAEPDRAERMQAATIAT